MSNLSIIKKVLVKLNFIKERQNPDIGFRRYLTSEQAEELKIKLEHAFTNHQIEIKEIEDIQNLFNNILRRIKGRIGNDVDDYVVNYYMRKIASMEFNDPSTDYAHVEIGLFFGSGIILILNALKNHHCKHSIIGIDPLNGYYVSDGADYSAKYDPITGIPINIELFNENVQKCGFDPKEVIVIKDYSQSEAALNIVRKYKICSIWIDGDHSYEGLKRDFNNYFPLVVPGGYILIDNYKDCHWLNKHWPGVTKFIECDLIPPNDLFKIILIHNRSVLLRKIC